MLYIPIENPNLFKLKHISPDPLTELMYTNTQIVKNIYFFVGGGVHFLDFYFIKMKSYYSYYMATCFSHYTADH